MQVSDTGSGMFVHVFGAYFGLAVSFALKPTKNVKKPSNSKSLFTIGSGFKHSIYKYGLTFLVGGAIFLWLLWPSFNACLAQDESAKSRAIINTYCSLASSCVIGFASSCFVSPDEKFNSVTKSMKQVIQPN